MNPVFTTSCSTIPSVKANLWDGAESCHFSSVATTPAKVVARRGGRTVHIVVRIGITSPFVLTHRFALPVGRGSAAGFATTHSLRSGLRRFPLVSPFLPSSGCRFPFEDYDPERGTRYVGNDLIPWDAPPRPDNGSRWDYEECRWVSLAEQEAAIAQNSESRRNAIAEFGRRKREREAVREL